MTTSFVGANDGGSSAAFLIELASELVCTKHKLTYWLVFFDGEEALERWSATDGLYGSRHFAARVGGKSAQLAFLRLGIPAVDLIDLDYGPFNLYWHRRSDTPDRCNSASLAIVGHTVLKTLEALASKVDLPRMSSGIKHSRSKGQRASGSTEELTWAHGSLLPATQPNRRSHEDECLRLTAIRLNARRSFEGKGTFHAESAPGSYRIS